MSLRVLMLDHAKVGLSFLVYPPVLTMRLCHILDDIPDGLFRQMTTCQTAANEFLRQYWLAAFPPPSEIQTIPSTPQQRAAKAHKMIEYISKTRDKVNALVQAAQRHGIDPSRVEIVSVFVDAFIARALLTGH